MDNEEYFRVRESAHPVARYDRDRGLGKAPKARHGPRLSLETRSHTDSDGDIFRHERSGEVRPHHRPRKMLLQPELGHLYEVLGNALAFYEDFSRGYDEEMRGIRQYAGPEILDRLWTIRAKAGDRSMGQGQRRAAEEDDGHARRPDYSTTHARSFRDCAEQVQNAFEVVIDVAPSFKRSMNPDGSPTDAESVSRMAKKIDAAYRGMSQLMRTAHKRQAHLTELVTEIELVLVYLDRIKSLWDCHATRVGIEEPPRSYPEQSEHGPPGSHPDTEQGQYLSMSCLLTVPLMFTAWEDD